MSSRSKHTKHPATQNKKKPHKRDQYARAMMIDLFILVGALLIWAGSNYIIPHFWELENAYRSVPLSTGQTVQLLLNKEDKTYERSVDGTTVSSGTYSLTGRNLKLVDSKTDFSDTYRLTKGALVSMNRFYEGDVSQSSRFNGTFTYTSGDTTTTIEFRRDNNYTMTIANGDGETTSSGTYIKDNGEKRIYMTPENATEDLQGLFVYEHQATEDFFLPAEG